MKPRPPANVTSLSGPSRVTFTAAEVSASVRSCRSYASRYSCTVAISRHFPAASGTDVSEPERADRFAKTLFGRTRESRNHVLAQPGAADRLADRVRRLGGVEDGNEDHVIVGHLDDLERAE